MAERELYGNDQEPGFPFDTVLPHLDWLPAALSKPAGQSLLPLLDTVLVFCRARTSMLWPATALEECHSLMLRLNAALREADASYHEMELVTRGRGLFFITCKNSPRFNWKKHLTHLEVGLNLDYSCPGHYYCQSPLPARGSNAFLERDSPIALFKEVFHLGVLDNFEERQEMIRFNSAKETLFNDAMQKLRLTYRFKWYMITRAIAEEAGKVMANEQVPSAEWWDNNCIYADGSHIGKVMPAPRFSFPNARYDIYWSIIRHMYNFVHEFEPAIILDANHIIDVPPNLYGSHLQLYKEVRDMLGKEIGRDEFIAFSDYVEQRTKEILLALNRYLAESGAVPQTIPQRRRINLRILAGSLWEDSLIWLFPSKVRKPLLRLGVPRAPGSASRELLF